MRIIACRASIVTPREHPARDRKRTNRQNSPPVQETDTAQGRAVQAKADWSCNHGGCNDRVCLFCCLQNRSIMIVIVYIAEIFQLSKKCVNIEIVSFYFLLNSNNISYA